MDQGWTYPCGVDGTDFETRRVELTDLFFEIVCCVEGVVAEVDVALESECEFAVCEEAGWCVFVIEPVVKRFEREQSAVEREHDLGRRRVHFHCTRPMLLQVSNKLRVRLVTTSMVGQVT